MTDAPARPAKAARAWPRAVLFDLDGTLIDSVGDIAAALNEHLGKRGLDSVPVEMVRTMVGDGVVKLVERAYRYIGHPLSGVALDAEVAALRKIYDKHLTEHTVLIPGAAEVVRDLGDRGILMGVVTNKPQSAAETVLGHFGLDRRLGTIVGDDGERARKPAPDMVRLALSALGVDRADAVLVGDGAADVGAARAAGVPAVLLEGGYGQSPAREAGPDRLISDFSELDDALDSLDADRRAAQ